MRNLSKAYDLIKEFEGLYLDAYQDPVGIWTIGYGTILYPNGRPVRKGDKCTKEQAQDWLEWECEEKIKQIEAMLKVPVNDNQFSALLSFAYNVGTDVDSDDIAEGLGDSTLLKKLNTGDYTGAAMEFLKWNKAGGKVYPGLVRRRKAEKALFETPTTVDFVPEKVNKMIDKDMNPHEDMNPLLMVLAMMFHWIWKSFGGYPEDKSSGLIPDNPDTGVEFTKTFSEGHGPRITKERVKQLLEEAGADTTKLCLLGVRGYYADTYGVRGKNDRGVYDDALIWYSPNVFRTFRANTDPSRERKGSGFGSGKGMAVLTTGRWKYKTGIHYGSVVHPAFRQADSVVVMRDGNPPYPQRGNFGINIHKGGANGTSSLGCQTVPREEWELFKSMGYGELAKTNQEVFDYVLLSEEDFRAKGTTVTG